MPSGVNFWNFPPFSVQKGQNDSFLSRLPTKLDVFLYLSELEHLCLDLAFRLAFYKEDNPHYIDEVAAGEYCFSCHVISTSSA